MRLRTLLLLVSLCSVATAQTTLQPVIPIERELDAQHVHEFTVKVQENDFVQLVVEQRGIDVIVRLFSPTGKHLGDFDSPDDDEGAEHVSFVAVAAGSYRVTVGPLNAKNVKGRYQIKVLEVRAATDQELKTQKNLALTKAKGVALLAEIEETIPQIKTPQTRIKAELQAGSLLWDVDQKRASKLFTDAATDFKEFLASNDDIFIFTSIVAPLRQEVVQAIAERDPDAALNFLHATSQIMSTALGETEHLRRESELELAIADHVMQKDPKRALQIARQSLKQGYSAELVSTLSELRRQEPALGAELADEIAMKVVNDKLLQLDVSSIAGSLIRFLPSPDSASQSTNGVASPPFLSEDRVKELVQKMLDEAMSYSPSKLLAQSYDQRREAAWNLLTALKSFSQLDTIIPDGSAAVEKKMAELNPSSPTTASSYAAGSNSGELSLEAIERMPVQIREQQYIQLAYGKGNSGDLPRARQIINEHVANPAQRRYALSQLDQTERQRALDDGRVQEVLTSLRGIQHHRDRAQQLSQIAHRIGPGLKRAAALNLLEQARNLLSPSPQARDQDEMSALLEISRAFLRYDVKRSFEIIDPLVEQFNELHAAARTLDGFSQEYYYGEELDLQNDNPLTTAATQLASVLGNQAVVNFERAKATADRIRAPEVRLKMYLDIVEQTIEAAK